MMAGVNCRVVCGDCAENTVGRVAFYGITQGGRKKILGWSLLSARRAGDARRGSANEEVETFRTPVFSRCRIARYRRLLVDQIVVLRDAEGRAFCRSDFAHQILRIQRNHGADAALAPAGFLCSVFTAGGSNLPPHRCDLLDACGLPLLVGRIVTIGRRHHPVAKILCAPAS